MSRQLHVRVVEGAEGADYVPYGGACDLFECFLPEVILSGPAETGKTRAVLEKLNMLCWLYPNLHCLLLRKAYKSLKTSAIVTYERKVLGEDGMKMVKKYGGESPQFYDYPTGSRIVCGGMDMGANKDSSKVLSAEYDVIVVNQAEELSLDDWEKLSTRCTGRAGNLRFQNGQSWSQLMGDCNPGPPTHWILSREREGHLNRIASEHKDNPTLWDHQKGAWTEQGKRSLAALDRLSGHRRMRLRDGLWVQSEGVVYDEFNRDLHVIPGFRIPPTWPRYRIIDFGFVHPFVCAWVALDEDRRIHIYRQIYMTGRTVATHAEQINRLSRNENIIETICDHDAEDRKTLEENGIPNVPAYKDVARGIDGVKERLLVQKDGRPRIFIHTDSLVEEDAELRDAHQPTDIQQSIESYLWDDHKSKDQPIKKDDDGADVVRYAVAHIDNLRARARRPARRTGSTVYGGREY